VNGRSDDQGDGQGKRRQENRGAELSFLEGTPPQVAREHASKKDEEPREKQEAEAYKENGIQQTLCGHGSWLVIALPRWTLSDRVAGIEFGITAPEVNSSA
jgi:hypothetical protein